MPTKPTKKAGKKPTVKFTVDCWQPVEDNVLDPSTFEKFLRDSIKINGKAGALGDTISIARDKTKVRGGAGRGLGGARTGFGACGVLLTAAGWEERRPPRRRCQCTASARVARAGRGVSR